MKLTDALRGEHGAFYMLFNEIEFIARTEGAMAQWRGATTVLEAMVNSHADLEDRLLFTALEPHLGKDHGPIAVMRTEHAELERILASMREDGDVGKAVLWIPQALAAARSHFQKEERVLFPMAEHFLGDEALARLGATWAMERSVTV